MEWRIDRAWKKKGYTISRVYLDGVRFGDGKKYCNALEDEDRGLTSAMTVDEILAVKKYGETAIPTGRYRVTMSYSPKFKKQMPLINAVKGYTGVRIHSGNTPADTLGCVLIGANTEKGKITNSRYWTGLVTGIIKAAIERDEDVFITIG